MNKVIVERPVWLKITPDNIVLINYINNLGEKEAKDALVYILGIEYGVNIVRQAIGLL